MYSGTTFDHQTPKLTVRPFSALMKIGDTVAESKGLLRNKIKHVKSMLANETRVNKYIDE